jgi:large subunit ribosomal protein L33
VRGGAALAPGTRGTGYGAPLGVAERGSSPRERRTPITLACSECKARNYKTTRSQGGTEPLEIKKYCKQCKRHTLHRETK